MCRMFFGLFARCSRSVVCVRAYTGQSLPKVALKGLLKVQDVITKLRIPGAFTPATRRDLFGVGGQHVAKIVTKIIGGDRLAMARLAPATFVHIEQLGQELGGVHARSAWFRRMLARSHRAGRA